MNYWDYANNLTNRRYISLPAPSACLLYKYMNYWTMQIIWLIEGISPSPPPLPAPRYHNLVGALDLRPHSYQGKGPQH